MSILYLHRTQAKGVEGVHIHEMARALTMQGYDVDILSPFGLTPVNAAETKIKRKKNKLYRSISRLVPELCFEVLEILYNFSAISKMKRLASKQTYAFVYERYAIFNWAGAAFSSEQHIPLILEINYTSFSPLVRQRSGLLKGFAHQIDRKIFSQAHGFVAVSSYLKDHLIQLGVAEEKIIVLPNAADPQKFNPEVSAEEVRKQYGMDGKVVIGFVGGFYPWHGLTLLVESFYELKQKIRNIFLCLVGEGPVLQELMSKIKDLGLESDCVLTGSVPFGRLPEYIAAFDIAVMPDSNDYGSPMKIYEYMAMAKPVIAPRLGPLEDGIKDGSEGILFKQHDKTALVDAMMTLAESKDMRIAMGVAGRKSVLTTHNWVKNAQGVLELFKQIQKKGAS